MIDGRIAAEFPAARVRVSRPRERPARRLPGAVPRAGQRSDEDPRDRLPAPRSHPRQSQHHRTLLDWDELAKRVRLDVDLTKARALGVSKQDLSSALEMSSRRVPGDAVSRGHRTDRRRHPHAAGGARSISRASPISRSAPSRGSRHSARPDRDGAVRAEEPILWRRGRHDRHDREGRHRRRRAGPRRQRRRSTRRSPACAPACPTATASTWAGPSRKAPRARTRSTRCCR